MSELLGPETHIDVMLSGRFDQDDVEWLVQHLRACEEQLAKLQTAAFEFIKVAALDDDGDYIRPIVKDLIEPDGLWTVLAYQGVVCPIDGLHHAPRCRANHWCRTVLPSRCTCGAAWAYAQQTWEFEAL